MSALLQGISRVKSISDMVGAVMKELRLQSSKLGEDFLLAVTVDAVIDVTGRSTIKKEDWTIVRKTCQSCCTVFCLTLKFYSGGSRGAHVGL